MYSFYERKKNSSHYEIHSTMHECVKVRKEFLSGGAKQTLRASFPALMFVSKKLCVNKI